MKPTVDIWNIISHYDIFFKFIILDWTDANIPSQNNDAINKTIPKYEDSPDDFLPPSKKLNKNIPSVIKPPDMNY